MLVLLGGWVGGCILEYVVISQSRSIGQGASQSVSLVDTGGLSMKEGMNIVVDLAFNHLERILHLLCFES